MADLLAVTNCLEAFVTKSVKAIAVNAVGELKTDTPVDTGFARSNWVPQIGSPFGGLAGSIDSVSTADQNTGLLGVIAGYTKGKIYISNNTSYIEALNAGSSKQAAPGFILRALVKAVKRTFVRP